MESSPMLVSVWNGLSSDILALVQNHPQLWRRLMMAGSAQVHAYAIWLHMGDRTGDPGRDANHLYDHRPPDLVAEVWPRNGHNVWRLLGKLPPHALERCQYERLERLAEGPAFNAMLANSSIEVRSLKFYDAIAGFDPLVAEAHRALQCHIGTAAMLHSGLTLLRAHNMLGREDWARKILRAAKRPRHLQQFLLKRLGKITLDTPALPDDSKLTPIRDLKTLLHQANKIFRNCVRFNPEYWTALMSGRLMFFVYNGEEPVLIAAETLNQNLVHLSEVRGIENETVTDEVLRQIHGEFQLAGFDVLPCGYERIFRGVVDDAGLEELFDEALLDAG